MNNSSRIIPSIICYTKDHRLFGENSITSLKQYLNTSYNNLSRLIGYNENIKLYKDEKLYGFEGIKKLNLKSSYYQNSEEEKEEIKSDVVFAILQVLILQKKLVILLLWIITFHLWLLLLFMEEIFMIILGNFYNFNCL